MRRILIPLCLGILAFITWATFSGSGVEELPDAPDEKESGKQIQVSEPKEENSTLSRAVKPQKVTRQEVAAVTDYDAAKSIHRLLALSLAHTLVGLKDETNRDLIYAQVKPLAGKFHLLKKISESRSFGDFESGSLGLAERSQVDLLIKIWPENSNLALEVDRIFAGLSLLDCEHVPYLLRRWLVSDEQGS